MKRPTGRVDGDPKAELYGRKDFAQGYYRSAEESANGRKILAEERAILRELIPVGSGGLILDVGSGTGRLLPVLRDLGYRPVGLDRSLAMLSTRRQQDQPRVLAEAQRLPCQSSAVEGVLAHRFLYHYQAIDQHLSEFARVLVPGGWLCVDMLRWTPSALFRSLAARSGRLVHTVPPETLEAEAARYGLQVRHSLEAFALNPATLGHLPHVVARHFIPRNAWPPLPRVKRYVLLQKTG